MHPEDLIRELQQGLLKWYGFKPHGTFLYLGEETDACAALLCEITGQPARTLIEQAAYTSTGQAGTSALPPEAFPDNLICASAAQTAAHQWQKQYAGAFDYIIAVETLERQSAPKEYLHHWKTLLKPDSTLILGMNNRFGLRYFCGDRDPYTDRNFDGIDGYRRVYSKKADTFQGRCYSRAELRDMLQDSGFDNFQFYSVLTDLKNPSFLYAEDYLPNEGLSNRMFPTYNYPDAVFLEDESLYNSLIENGMFHEIANAYLIECPLSGELSSHGIPAVGAKLENGSYIMPYISAEVGQLYLKKLLHEDLEKFLLKMDEFRNLALRSSETVKPDLGDGEGAVLQKGYIDMVLLNSFYINGTFVFYDQEFCVENYPANALIWRMVATFSAGALEAQKLLAMDVLLDWYGLFLARECAVVAFRVSKDRMMIYSLTTSPMECTNMAISKGEG